MSGGQDGPPQRPEEDGAPLSLRRGALPGLPSQGAVYRWSMVFPPLFGLAALRAPRAGSGPGIHEDGDIHRRDEEAAGDRVEARRACPLLRDEAGRLAPRTPEALYKGVSHFAFFACLKPALEASL